MGNACFCNNSNYIRDVRLDSIHQQPIINTKTEQIIHKDSIENDKMLNNINNIINYFNESEKEIINNIKKKEKSKKNANRKKPSNRLDTLIDTDQYEEMLKRLLDQKQIIRYGPKRRETIRKEDKIKIIVNEILKENKDIILNKKNKKSEIKSSIIIKNKNGLNNRFSFDKNGIFFSGINKNYISNK